MKLIVNAIIGVSIAFFLSFYIDREIVRREYIARTDLRQKIVDCRFETNCRHYNKLLNQTENNKEEWEE